MNGGKCNLFYKSLAKDGLCSITLLLLLLLLFLIIGDEFLNSFLIYGICLCKKFNMIIMTSHEFFLCRVICIVIRFAYFIIKSSAIVNNG